MKEPKRFIVKGKETWGLPTFNSIYGLKQAPRLWYQLLDNVLGTFVYRGKTLKRSNADKCIYILKIEKFILIRSRRRPTHGMICKGGTG